MQKVKKKNYYFDFVIYWFRTKIISEYFPVSQNKNHNIPNGVEIIVYRFTTGLLGLPTPNSRSKMALKITKLTILSAFFFTYFYVSQTKKSSGKMIQYDLKYIWYCINLIANQQAVISPEEKKTLKARLRLTRSGQPIIAKPNSFFLSLYLRQAVISPEKNVID